MLFLILKAYLFWSHLNYFKLFQRVLHLHNLYDWYKDFHYKCLLCYLFLVLHFKLLHLYLRFLIFSCLFLSLYLLLNLLTWSFLFGLLDFFSSISHILFSIGKSYTIFWIPFLTSFAFKYSLFPHFPQGFFHVLVFLFSGINGSIYSWRIW